MHIVNALTYTIPSAIFKLAVDNCQKGGLKCIYQQLLITAPCAEIQAYTLNHTVVLNVVATEKLTTKSAQHAMVLVTYI